MRPECNILHKSTLQGPFFTYHPTFNFYADFIKEYKFVYQQASFSFTDVNITAIKYAKQITSLLLGFNFGCFVIYSLYSSSVSYISPCSVHRLLPPVIDFAYMEPEEDPRGFVYLWVAKGNAKVSTNQW